MDKIQWDDTYSVGVAKMDQEHRNIVSIINLMVDRPNVSEHSETFSDILGQLTTYAYEHFEHEEELLEAYDFPALAAQKREHQAFRRKIALFCLKVMDEENPPAGASEELLSYLLAWWKDHILVSDMQYRPFLEGLNVT